MLIGLMPLTKQGDELVHAVGQGCRDETEAGCVAVDQVRVSARAFKCLLEVTLRPIHSELKGANAVHRTFDEHGIILSDRLQLVISNYIVNSIVSSAVNTHLNTISTSPLTPPLSYEITVIDNQTLA